MSVPVKAKDVKLVQGRSGRGLQIVCACGCINWNHVEISEATWICRNCGRVLAHDFPGLVQKVLAADKQETGTAATSPG